MSAPIVLVGGGVRSGKSAFALVRARELGTRRAFVATAQAFDDEMRARIDAHVSERGDAFTTFEEPRALPEVLDRLEGYDVVVVDCLTLWLSNLLLDERSDPAIDASIAELARLLAQRIRPTILITNEVGMGIVPPTPLGRRFRDHAGRLHQRLAPLADEIYVGMLGVLLRVKPSPVMAMTSGAGA